MAREGWTLEVFESHEAAADADRIRFRAMTPDQRVQDMLELIDAWTGASQQDLIELIGLLKSHGVEFLVAGAHVLAHHGRPRFTEDLDFFIRRNPGNVLLVRDALNEFGFELTEEAEERLRDDTRGFIALGRKPNRIDLLNFLDGVEFDEAWRRRSAGRLAGIDVDFLGLDDYVATKRASGRPKDRIDLELLREAVGPLPGDEP